MNRWTVAKTGTEIVFSHRKVRLLWQESAQGLGFSGICRVERSSRGGKTGKGFTFGSGSPLWKVELRDRTVISAPNIESRIGEEGQITGSFTMQEAEDLALKLRSGALPASLTYLQEETIGPTLGADSIRSGVIASLASLALVGLFMLFYYRLSGVNAVVALVFNLIILLGAMSYIGAVMTLPGIAGFVLTMGVGVDSNVLIFERIKEELAAQRGVRASINTGFSRVIWTLVDTHVSALISAGFLFQFGTGPIKGFAITLSIGLISSTFTSVVVTHDMRSARRLGQRILMLRNQHIYAAGTADEIFNSKDPVVRQFIEGVSDPKELSF